MQLVPSSRVSTISRRDFLALTSGLFLVQTQAPVPSPVQFVDVAQEAGITAINVNGGTNANVTLLKAQAAELPFSITTMMASRIFSWSTARLWMVFPLGSSLQIISFGITGTESLLM